MYVCVSCVCTPKGFVQPCCSVSSYATHEYKQQHCGRHEAATITRGQETQQRERCHNQQHAQNLHARAHVRGQQ